MGARSRLSRYLVIMVVKMVMIFVVILVRVRSIGIFEHYCVKQYSGEKGQNICCLVSQTFQVI